MLVTHNLICFDNSPNKHCYSVIFYKYIRRLHKHTYLHAYTKSYSFWEKLLIFPVKSIECRRYACNAIYGGKGYSVFIMLLPFI